MPSPVRPQQDMIIGRELLTFVLQIEVHGVLSAWHKAPLAQLAIWGCLQLHGWLRSCVLRLAAPGWMPASLQDPCCIT